MYVVNQGHLPTFFEYNPLSVQFGTISEYHPRGFKTWSHTCERPAFGNQSIHPGGAAPNACQYLLEGKEEFSRLSTRSTLGYGFYGFTKNVRLNEKITTIDSDSDHTEEPYKGSIVLVPTDKVQSSFLEGHGMSSASARKLRPLNTNTAAKGGVNAAKDDVISIGSMPNLGEYYKVTVNTGAGNDALNIDGQIGPLTRSNPPLTANLGSGQNTLSFDGIASDSPIKGIMFSAPHGLIRYFRSLTPRSMQTIGRVKNVKILGASPFTDHIKLAASPTDEKVFGFTVIKSKGLATYEVDLSKINNRGVRRFKIIDSSSTSDGNCDDHNPELRITNLIKESVVNDILFQGDRVKIYSKKSGRYRFRGLGERRKRMALEEERVDNQDLTGRQLCSGDDSSHPEGGQGGKYLMATVTLYSKCPVRVTTKNIEGDCVMRPRMMNELDKNFFHGSKTLVDFSNREYLGTDNTDFVELKCPTNKITHAVQINLKSTSSDTRDILMISDE
eukprot:gene8639-9571_t